MDIAVSARLDNTGHSIKFPRHTDNKLLKDAAKYFKAIHPVTVADLSSTGVSDLGPLAGLAQLQTLYLPLTEVSDLTPLAGLTNLRELNLSYAAVSDLGPLAGLAQLQTLDLKGTQVSDLTPVTRAGLTVDR